MASINFEFLHDEDGDGKDEEEANLQGKADLHSRFDVWIISHLFSSAK